jgi:phosphoglucosamine mutase
MLESAIAAGLASSGIEVLLAGVIPTPAVAYLTVKNAAAFGVVISASHNPFEDNGIKFFGPTGYKLGDDDERAIESEFDHPQSGKRPIGKGVGRIRQFREATEAYAEFAASTLPETVSLAGVRIALDMANGAAFRTTPTVLANLGAEVDLHYAAPDGFNINVDCGSTCPATLARIVRQSGAAFGLAHDGDADRVLLCDEHSSALDGDELLAVASLDLIQRNQLHKKTLVATVMSNFGLDDLLHKHGGSVVRTPVGDRFVMDALVQLQLNLGGEQSGHVIFRDFVTTGDGLIAALQIIGVVLRTGKSLSELRQVLHKYPQVLRNIVVREKVPFENIGVLNSKIQEAESLLKGKGRLVLRYSGTEPKARLLLEGPDSSELQQLASSIAEEFAKYVGP